MKTKNWLILLASCVALASAPMMGCGDDSDPSGNNNNNNDAADVVSDDDTDEGTADTDDEGTPDTDDEGDPDVDDGDPDVDEGETDTNNTPSDCVPNDWYTGQVFAAGSNPHNGGVPVDITTTPLTTPLADANLAAVNAAMPATEMETVTNPDTEETYERAKITTKTVSIEVTGALVVSTGYDQGWSDYDDGNGTLWLQDANATAYAYQMLDETNQPDEAVQVGDTVSFTVTEVTNYKGLPEITGVTGFTIVNSTPDTTEVPFSDLTGEDVGLDQYGKLVRVSGELTSNDGDCSGGNGTICYTLTHGDKSITLRTGSDRIAVGSCVTFVGPVGANPSILVTNGTPEAQLDVINFGWMSYAE